jgi:DNA-binding GntR family transcriptional regulator
VLANAVAFPAPVAPPTDPVFPVQPTAAQINEAVRQHQEAVRIFNRYLDTDRAFVQLIIAATPDTYIEALCDPIFGYANVTTLSLMTHVQTTYGAMTAADREANLVRMSAPSSPPALI